MSTYWYFECLDHDPPLQLGDEFTQHTDDMAFWQGIAIAHARPIPEDAETFGTFSMNVDRYFAANARAALYGHPACRIGLVNEYGDRRPLPEQALQDGEADRG